MIILLAACKGRERDPLAFEPPIFPETKQVTITHLPNNFVFNRLAQLVDIGNYLVVKSYYADRYMHLFDKETGAYLKSFGQRGRGHGELASVSADTDE